MVWLPTVKLLVVQAIWPEAKDVVKHLPTKGCPSTLNTTEPVGVPAVDVTVAVNVTLCPEFEGFNEDVTLVVVAALAIWKDCGTSAAAL